VGQRVRVSRLDQRRLLLSGLVDRVVHVDLTGNISKGRIESSRNQNAPAAKPNCHRIRLQNQILRDELLAPIVLGEIILQDELGIVAVSKEVALRYRLHLVVEKLEGMLIRELDDIVLQRSNTLEKLRGDYRIVIEQGSLRCG